jgi:hypothetical protein
VARFQRGLENWRVAELPCTFLAHSNVIESSDAYNKDPILGE